jgi:hypothetical protein
MADELQNRPGEAPHRPRVGGAVAWLAVALLTAGLTALTTAQAIKRYGELRSGWSWDLAYYNQWFWALTVGDGVITVRPIAGYATDGPSVWKTNYLAPVRWLIAPFYRLVPDPRTLLVVQNVMFWWLIPAAYTLVRSETRSTAVALAAVALVPLTPLLWPLVWNDFRELQLALPFVLWGFQGVRGRDRAVTALGVGGMLACRQEYALVVATLALLPPREAEDIGRTYRWAHALVVLAVAWFLFGFLGHLKLSFGTLATTRYLARVDAKRAALGDCLITAAGFLALGLGCWGVFLFRRIRVALPVLPWLWGCSSGGWALRYLATEEWHEVRYTAPMVATGLAAGLIGFGQVAIWLQDRPRGRIWLAAVWLAAAAGSGLALAGLIDRAGRQPRLIDPAEASAVWTWIGRVGPGDGVLATYEVAAPLSSRRVLYSDRLYRNRPQGYPVLRPEIGWVFLRNADRTTEVFVDQGFEVVHRGRFLTVLRREARSRAERPG